MAKNVYLTLRYCMGDYSDMEEDGNEISTDPKKWEDSFFQSDIMMDEFEIIGVEVVETGDA